VEENAESGQSINVGKVIRKMALLRYSSGLSVWAAEEDGTAARRRTAQQIRIFLTALWQQRVR
jgi:hypothetical protein